MQDTETRMIKLSSGHTLEVMMKPGFLDRVASHFLVQDVQSVTDDHIRMYIFGAFKNAIDKAEHEGYQVNTA